MAGLQGRPRDQNPYNGPGISIIDATFKSATALECGSGGQDPDGMPEVDGKCSKVSATTKFGTAALTVDAARAKAGIAAVTRSKSSVSPRRANPPPTSSTTSNEACR